MVEEPNARVQQQFGAAAPAYVSSAVHASGPDLAKLVSAAGCSGSERVLDLGTAAGHTAMALAPHVAQATGVDITQEMVAVARDLARERGIGNVEFRVADVSHLPFDDGQFDIVSSRYSAHHYPRPELAVAEAYRVLKPGGRLLLVDTVSPEDPYLDTFINCVELLRDRSHVRDKQVAEWMGLLSMAGFAVEVMERWHIDLDGAEWVQRMRTPEQAVAMIRTLMREAPPEAKDAFALRHEEPWSFRLPSAMVRGIRPPASIAAA